MLFPLFDAVPAELRSVPQWVCWRLQPRPGEDKPTKVPYNPRTSGRAMADNADTWADFSAARGVYERSQMSDSPYSGVGFQLGTVGGPLFAVDLDKCIDPETGEVATWAQEIVAALPTYWERSPSGTGLRAVGRGALPEGGRNRKGPVEMYDRLRYVTLTGHVFGPPAPVADCADVLPALHARLFPIEVKTASAPRPAAPLSLSDGDLINKAISASNGAAFSALWNGNTSAYGGDDSAADLALCGMLAFWAQGDESRIDALFRQSGLYREKWERGDYRARTLGKAMSGKTEFYTPRSGARSAKRGASGGQKVAGGEKTAPSSKSPPEESPPDVPYHETAQGLVFRRHSESGFIDKPLCNFTARIVADVVEDDGAEVRRSFEMEARRAGRTVRFSIPASSYAQMNWPTEQLGASAFLYPGMGAKDHARVGFQILSGEPPQKHEYGHTGWREVNPQQWAYLHGGGAIGTSETVQVSSDLERFSLPTPPTGERLVAAVAACLDLWNLMPHMACVPVALAPFRAMLGGCDFSLFLAGASGVFKSELAALAQQHYGAGMDARHLPGSWSSSPNALEGMAFKLKDALFTIDDFAPTGTAQDVQKLHSLADRVLRGQGNGAGRGRMNADSSLRATRYARGLIVSTGEDVPKGQSLRARALILEISPGMVDAAALTECQKKAAAGIYAEALSGFAQWLAPQYARVQSEKTERLRTLRDRAVQGLHRRTPDIVASVAWALETFLRFAEDSRAVTTEQSKDLARRGWAALSDAAQAQSAHQVSSEPTARYIELLGAALSSGKAHLTSPIGGEPPRSLAWGWREQIVGQEAVTRAMGTQIGWLTAEGVYLIPDAAYAVARQQGEATGDGLTLTVRSLHKRLHERKMLASTDVARKTLTVRQTLSDQRQNVLHLPLRLFSADSFSADETDLPPT